VPREKFRMLIPEELVESFDFLNSTFDFGYLISAGRAVTLVKAGPLTSDR
jgi:hypothetical protein